MFTITAVTPLGLETEQTRSTIGDRGSTLWSTIVFLAYGASRVRTTQHSIDLLVADLARPWDC